MNFPFIAFESIEAAEQAFYEAMRTADLDAMMSVWADDDDILCIHPNGHRLIGQDAIRQSWQAIFDHGAINLRVLQPHGGGGSRFAVRSVIEEITVESVRGIQIAQCLATNIFVRHLNGWRLAVHHASPIGEPEPATRGYGEVLH